MSEFNLSGPAQVLAEFMGLSPYKDRHFVGFIGEGGLETVESLEQAAAEIIRASK